MEAMSPGSSTEVCFSLVSAGVGEREEGEHAPKRKDMCRDREDDFVVVLYTPMLTVS